MKRILKQGAWGREALIDGRTYLHFGGTSYLGMHYNSKFLSVLGMEILNWGAHFGSSRNSNLGLSIYHQAERALADYFRAPDALLTSSGYMAGQLLYHHFRSESRTLVYAPGAHPALGPTDREESNWEDILNHNTAGDPAPVLFMDSIGENGNSWPDFSALRQLNNNQYLVVSDDSHAFGVVEEGSGCYQELRGILGEQVVVCGSLGKGMGLPAGIVLGEPDLIESLRQSPVYQTSSPPSPAHLATFLKLKQEYKNAHSRLRENLQQAAVLLKPYNFLRHRPGYPVFTFSEPALARHLENNDILPTYFPYQGQFPGRIVISALHTDADLEKLNHAMSTFKLR